MIDDTISRRPGKSAQTISWLLLLAIAALAAPAAIEAAGASTLPFLSAAKAFEGICADRDTSRVPSRPHEIHGTNRQIGMGHDVEPCTADPAPMCSPLKALGGVDWNTLKGLTAASPPAWFGKALYIQALSHENTADAVRYLETWMAAGTDGDLAGLAMASSSLASRLKGRNLDGFLKTIRKSGPPMILAASAGSDPVDPEAFASAAALLESCAMESGDSSEDNLPFTGALLTMALRRISGIRNSLSTGGVNEDLPPAVASALQGNGALGISVEVFISSAPGPLTLGIAAAAAGLRGDAKWLAEKISGVSDESAIAGLALPFEALLDGGEPGPAFAKFTDFISDAAIQADGARGLLALGAAASAHGWKMPPRLAASAAILLSRVPIEELTKEFDPEIFGMLFHLARAMALEGMPAGAGLAKALGKAILARPDAEKYYHSAGECAAVTALVEPMAAMKLIEGIRSLEWRVNALRRIFRIWGMTDPGGAMKFLDSLEVWGGPVDAAIRLDLSLDLYGGMAEVDPETAVAGLKTLPKSTDRDFYLAMAAPALAAQTSLEAGMKLLMDIDAQSGLGRTTDTATAMARMACDLAGPCPAPGNPGKDSPEEGEGSTGNRGIPGRMPLIETLNPAMAWPGPYLSYPMRY